MYALLKLLSRFSYRARSAARVVLFIVVTVIAVPVVLLVYESAIGAFLICVVFALIITPISVSLSNERYEMIGVYGVYTNKPIHKS